MGSMCWSPRTIWRREAECRTASTAKLDRFSWDWDRARDRARVRVIKRRKKKKNDNEKKENEIGHINKCNGCGVKWNARYRTNMHTHTQWDSYGGRHGCVFFFFFRRAYKKDKRIETVKGSPIGPPQTPPYPPVPTPELTRAAGGLDRLSPQLIISRLMYTVYFGAKQGRHYSCLGGGGRCFHLGPPSRIPLVTNSRKQCGVRALWDMGNIWLDLKLRIFDLIWNSASDIELSS